MNRPLLFFFVVLLAALPLRAAGAQEPSGLDRKSPQKAFALSLLVPGLGHRYVHDGSWRGAASLFAFTDAGLWLGLLGTEWQRAQLVQSYRTLAAGRADAHVEGKDRAFFLNLATYRSSDEYLEVQLRNRAWNRLDYVTERAFQWEWASEEDFRRFRRLREDAESRRRSQPFLIALLAANRLVAGLTALRAATRANSTASDVSVSFSPAPSYGRLPMLNLNVRL